MSLVFTVCRFCLFVYRCLYSSRSFTSQSSCIFLFDSLAGWGRTMALVYSPLHCARRHIPPFSQFLGLENCVLFQLRSFQQILTHLIIRAKTDYFSKLSALYLSWFSSCLYDYKITKIWIKFSIIYESDYNAVAGLGRKHISLCHTGRIESLLYGGIWI